MITSIDKEVDYQIEIYLSNARNRMKRKQKGFKINTVTINNTDDVVEDNAIDNDRDNNRDNAMDN